MVHLDHLLAARGMTAAELARRIDLTPVNLSILRTGKARAIRFSTLAAICEVLECQPADLLTVGPDDTDDTDGTGGTDDQAGSVM
jgi:putative transcriptional regulator